MEAKTKITKLLESRGGGSWVVFKGNGHGTECLRYFIHGTARHLHGHGKKYVVRAKVFHVHTNTVL